MTIRIMIVDDHEVVRHGLRFLLSLDIEMETVGEAANGHEAVELARRLKPDVVLMDLLMPVMDGITATATIAQELPDTEVVALTSALEDSMVAKAVQAGAIGYLLKDTRAAALTTAIKAAAEGQVQLAPAAARSLMRETTPPATRSDALTTRETEVLRLLARGYSNKEIAGLLQVGDKTIKTHVHHILNKLDVPSRTQAVLCAMRMGLVAVDAH